MATKESKRQVRELIEGLELRVHRGPPVRDAEIKSVKDYLRQNEFSPSSDYFSRLTHLESRLQSRAPALASQPAKRNYGGEAAGYQMQVQSIYDHVILSTCYHGEFNGQRGRVKISHRFNQQGRIDFVELKYLRSLHPALNGELRKLLLVDGYTSLRKDWLEAPASVLRILPQELVFLYPDVFRCERLELFAWLVNIGHGLLGDLLQDLRARPAQSARSERPPVVALVNGHQPHTLCALQEEQAVGVVSPESWQAHSDPVLANGTDSAFPSSPRPNPDSAQLDLRALLQDRVGLPILEKAAALEAVVEGDNLAQVVIRYVRRGPV
jgi:hypothetical protein